MKFRTFARALTVATDTPPTEFCLFVAGVNESSKGPVLFDDVAAAAVMAAYQRAGVDLMIDLEHQALYAPEARADAADARGWAQLELRGDGSLWAVRVTWTPDGARRLLEKTQRYTSPAFMQDESGRVVEIINCAIVAMPATYDAAPLVAASRVATRPVFDTPSRAATLLSNSMDPEQIKAAIDALTNGTLATALGLDASAKPSEIVAAVQAAAAAVGGGEPSSPYNAPPTDPAAESADVPVTNALNRIMGTSTSAEALAALSAMRAKVDALDGERRTLEAAQRTELVTALVTLGVEFPATAWDGDPEARVPCRRLASEPLAELRDRVTALRKLKPAPVVAPPAAPKAGIESLSRGELSECKRLGIDPADFLERKANAVRRSK